MKKKRFCTLILFSLVAFSSCRQMSAEAEAPLPIAVIQLDSYNFPDDFSALENETPIILRGILGSEQQQYTEHTIEQFPDTVTFGCTISSFVITESFKGPYKAGDTVNLGELYYKSDGVIRCYGDYLPGNPGTEYLFFLKEARLGETNTEVLIPMYRELGRYIVPTGNLANRSAEAYTNVELELGDGANQKYYLSFYKEAIEKYAG